MDGFYSILTSTLFHWDKHNEGQHAYANLKSQFS